MSGMLLALAASACSHEAAGVDPAISVSLPSVDVPQTSWRSPPGAYLAERNLCIDRELARRGLNEYGDTAGTTYPAGTPLSATAAQDRYGYVLGRRPDIAVTCARAPREEQP